MQAATKETTYFCPVNDPAISRSIEKCLPDAATFIFKIPIIINLVADQFKLLCTTEKQNSF